MLGTYINSPELEAIARALDLDSQASLLDVLTEIAVLSSNVKSLTLRVKELEDRADSNFNDGYLCALGEYEDL